LATGGTLKGWGRVPPAARMQRAPRESSVNVVISVPRVCGCASRRIAHQHLDGRGAAAVANAHVALGRVSRAQRPEQWRRLVDKPAVEQHPCTSVVTRL
jgi:hypothetical protein